MKILIINVLLLVGLYSCSSDAQKKVDNPALSRDSTKKNIDYVVRDEVFGNQTWMKSHLDVIIFNNGDSIYEAKTKQDWVNAGNRMQPAYSYCEVGSLNYILYNWYAINDKRGIIPDGWRLPNKKDIEILIENLGGIDNIPKNIFSGKASFGKFDSSKISFTTIPCGIRDYYGNFDLKNEYAYYWLADSSKNNFDGIERGTVLILNVTLPMVTHFPKQCGCSVKCIKK